MGGSGAFCTSHALPSKPRHHASFHNFPGVCSVFCLRLFCLNFSGKSAGGRKVSLCRAAGGADGHFRPNKRHLRTAPDPDSDGAEAGPLSSATPAYRIGPRKCVFTYSIEYLDRRLTLYTTEAPDRPWSADHGQGPGHVYYDSATIWGHGSRLSYRTIQRRCVLTA